MAEIRCQLCDRVADSAVDGDPPLTWVLDQDADGRHWTCASCAAQHVRSIEAKLERRWW